MTNRPKAIGTRGESAVVAFLRAHGFNGAERRALHGSTDLGDVTGIGPVVIEVKAGQAAKTASDGLVALWLEQTDTERRNAKADIGILVMARSGIGPQRAGEWWAVVPSRHLNPFVHDRPLRMHLRECVRLLRELGHGSPLSDEERAAA